MNTWLNLKDNVIIVTGGASGIGLAIVDELLSQGAHVQMIDIHGGDRHHNGDNYHFWPTDISSATEVQQTIDAIIQRWSRIDGLVNNAGVNFPRLLVDEKAPAGRYELNEAAFEKMVNINQKGVFFMSQAVARQMVKQRAGVIVNVSSESGLEGSEGQSCYAATKAALNSFTRSWSKELGKYGIRVVGVAPGILEKTGLRTPEYEEALAWTRNITVEQLREGYTKNAIPIGRAGKLSEVADFVCYLLSARASYITGVTTNIAGGKTRGSGGSMVHAIFCAHGQLAGAMLDSVCMVYGEVNVSAVAFVPGENAADIAINLEKLVSAHTDEEWVIAVDLQCGSPWNAAAGLAMRHPQIRVISGLSLPLALELVDNQYTLSADDLCQHLQAIASQCCVVWQQPETVEEEF